MGRRRTTTAPLTARRQRFVEEYLIDLNGAHAAIRAGYSAKGAHIAGIRLLRDATVRAAIDARMRKTSKRLKLSREKVLRQLAGIAFSDIGDVLDFSGDQVHLRPAADIPRYARRAIASIKVKRYVEGKGEDARVCEIVEVRLWPKDAALEKLAKHLGLLVDRHEMTTTVGEPVVFRAVWGNGQPTNPVDVTPRVGAVLGPDTPVGR